MPAFQVHIPCGSAENRGGGVLGGSQFTFLTQFDLSVFNPPNPPMPPWLAPAESGRLRFTEPGIYLCVLHTAVHLGMRSSEDLFGVPISGHSGAVNPDGLWPDGMLVTVANELNYGDLGGGGIV